MPLSREARASGRRVTDPRSESRRAQVLTFLRRHGPSTDHEIAEALGLPLATVNGVRHGLVKRGLVTIRDLSPCALHRSSRCQARGRLAEPSGPDGSLECHATGAPTAGKSFSVRMFTPWRELDTRYGTGCLGGPSAITIQSTHRQSTEPEQLLDMCKGTTVPKVRTRSPIARRQSRRPAADHHGCGQRRGTVRAGRQPCRHGTRHSAVRQREHECG